MNNNSLIQEKKSLKMESLQLTYLEGIKTPIMSIDQDFTVTYMNTTGAELLNQTTDSVVGKKCFDLFKTDDCNTSNCACFRAMKTGKPATSQTIARAGGGQLPIQYTGSPLTDQTGKIIGAAEFVSDITELKNTMNSVTAVVKIATEVAANIECLSSDIHVTSKNVGEMCRQTAQASEELSSSMTQLQTASNQVSKGSENLSKLAQQSAVNVESLSTLMSQVHKQAEEVNLLVDESNKLAATMSEEGKAALGSLSEIKGSATNVEKTLGEVNASVESVAGLAGDISDIAGQVNMLALNAAIEAARAGEAGRGFAVVADAVKQLAGKAGIAAKTAVVSIDEITKSGKKATQMAQSAGQAAKNGDLKVSEALNGAEKVAASMHKIREITDRLQDNIKGSVTAIERVNDAIQQVASFSEEAASAAEESASGIEEQTATTEEVTAQNQKISEAMIQAIELSQKIAAEVKNLRAQLAKAQTKQSS
jgi:methyl-accepting chemotaxis protein